MKINGPILAGVVLAVLALGAYMSKPRGIRNHNPGNIRHGSKWQGMAAIQTDKSFVQFDSAEWGIRALYKVLLTYRNKHSLDSVAGIIDRWAPPSENDTGAYVESVARRLGVSVNETLSLDRYPELVAAIIKHENGRNPYDMDTIRAGIGLA